MTTREKKKLEKFARGETRKQIAEKHFSTFKVYREKGLTHKEISEKMGMSIKIMEYYQRRINKGFREKATEEDLKNLAEYLDTVKSEHKPITKALPCKEKGWNFTYGFAASLLRERGIWEPIERKPKHASVPDEPEPMPFTLDPIPSGTKYRTRSIQISEDVAQRLKTFTDAQIGCHSKAVISQIISKGLEIYGA